MTTIRKGGRRSPGDETFFRRDVKGRRAVLGNYEKMQTDRHFKDYTLFYQYFDGENRRGLDASHQTGWSGLIANMIAKVHGQVYQVDCRRGA